MPSVLPVATRALLAACRRLGLDAGALRASAGLADVDLDDPDLRIAPERADALWRAALQASGDPLLALRAAEQTPFGAFRVLDYLGASGASAGEGLARIAAYFPLVDGRASLDLEESAGAVSLVLRAAAGVPPPPAQEYTLAILASRVRHVVAPSAASLGVRFTFARPMDVREHARILGVEPEFEAPAPALVVGRRTWDAPVASRDPGLFAALDAHARAMLGAAGEGLAARVRGAVAAELPGREPTLATVARRLGTSPRTLQRRLEAAGASFASVADGVRRERAEDALRAPDVSIAEVSWLVGFAEQSAFARAFRRWTGVAPSAWRRAAATRRRPPQTS